MWIFLLTHGYLYPTVSPIVIYIYIFFFSKYEIDGLVDPSCMFSISFPHIWSVSFSCALILASNSGNQMTDVVPKAKCWWMMPWVIVWEWGCQLCLSQSCLFSPWFPVLVPAPFKFCLFLCHRFIIFLFICLLLFLYPFSFYSYSYWSVVRCYYLILILHLKNFKCRRKKKN